MKPDTVAQAGADLASTALHTDTADVLEDRMRTILAPLSEEEAGAACFYAIYGLAHSLRHVLGHLPETIWREIAATLLMDAHPAAAPPLDLPQGKCRSCGAPVYWLKYLPTGQARPSEKLNPIDVAPDAQGNIIITAGRYRIVGTAHPDLPHYTSHFATCPQATQHRGGGAPR